MSEPTTREPIAPSPDSPPTTSIDDAVAGLKMDAAAVRRTLASGRTWFWSRSRRQYWQKGETSGHVQHVRSVTADCDGDTLLVRVEQVGPACHTGTRSCFTHPLGREDDRRAARVRGVRPLGQ